METLQTRQPGNKKLFTIISIPTKYFKGMSDEQHKFIFNVFYYFVRMSYLTPAVSTQFNPIELSVLNKSCLAWMKVPSADNGRVSLRSPARIRLFFFNSGRYLSTIYLQGTDEDRMQGRFHHGRALCTVCSSAC